MTEYLDDILAEIRKQCAARVNDLQTTWWIARGAPCVIEQARANTITDTWAGVTDNAGAVIAWRLETLHIVVNVENEWTVLLCDNIATWVAELAEVFKSLTKREWEAL